MNFGKQIFKKPDIPERLKFRKKGARMGAKIKLKPLVCWKKTGPRLKWKWKYLGKGERKPLKKNFSPPLVSRQANQSRVGVFFPWLAWFFQPFRIGVFKFMFGRWFFLITFTISLEYRAIRDRLLKTDEENNSSRLEMNESKPFRFQFNSNLKVLMTMTHS